MSDVIIRAERLGKKYRIRHKNESFHYTALRDVIVERCIAAARRLSPIGRQGSDSRESIISFPAQEDFWALKGVSFEITRGEVLGVIGRNGAGKSTLLKILSRITEPSEGRVTMDGRVASLLEVGTGFHPELTGRENIFLNGAILGMSRAEIERKFDEIVAFAEVERFLDTPVKRYSSGMYVRLAFAVAAHLEPEILIVDEVLAVGDANFQKKCLGKMASVVKDHERTIIFVSHDMTAVQRLCSRVLWLDLGGVMAEGDTYEITRKYLEDNTTWSGERTWTDLESAPGDEVVRVRAVRALDGVKKVESMFSVRDSIWLEIEFKVLVTGHVLDAGFYIYDADGRQVFNAGDFQVDDWQKPRPAGIHRSRCRIPADFLNEGRYTVMCYVSEHPYITRALINDALSVQIVDTMGPGGARGHYTRAWPGGAVRPLLEWELAHWDV